MKLEEAIKQLEGVIQDRQRAYDHPNRNPNIFQRHLDAWNALDLHRLKELRALQALALSFSRTERNAPPSTMAERAKAGQT